MTYHLLSNKPYPKATSLFETHPEEVKGSGKALRPNPSPLETPPTQMMGQVQNSGPKPKNLYFELELGHRLKRSHSLDMRL